jgi:hypothetical protein
MAAEGLAYCIMRRVNGGFTLPSNASAKQVLDDFLKFCAIGALDDNDQPIELPSGKMTGVVNWLAGVGKYKANFYIARKPALMFFASLPVGSNPWSDMPGFLLFVKSGNLTLNLGTTGELKSTGEFILEPQPDLDNALASLENPISRVSAERKSGLLAALRGDPDTDLDTVLDDLEAEEQIGLRGFLQEQLATFKNRFGSASQISERKQEQK